MFVKVLFVQLMLPAVVAGPSGFAVALGLSVKGMWPTELVNLPSAALLRAVLLGETVASGLQYDVGRRHL